MVVTSTKGSYLYMVRVIRFFSKALTGAQLNWSTREKECYGIYFGCKTFEDLLDNRHFILKTDHMNLTYLMSHWPGRYSDGNFICRIKTSTCAMFLERKFISSSLTHCRACARTTCSCIFDTLLVGHWGLQKCREFLNDPTITDRTITQFTRQCPCCQVMSRLKILI